MSSQIKDQARTFDKKWPCKPSRSLPRRYSNMTLSQKRTTSIFFFLLGCGLFWTDFYYRICMCFSHRKDRDYSFGILDKLINKLFFSLPEQYKEWRVWFQFFVVFSIILIISLFCIKRKHLIVNQLIINQVKYTISLLAGSFIWFVIISIVGIALTLFSGMGSPYKVFVILIKDPLIYVNVIVIAIITLLIVLKNKWVKSIKGKEKNVVVDDPSNIEICYSETNQNKHLIKGTRIILLIIWLSFIPMMLLLMELFVQQI